MIDYRQARPEDSAALAVMARSSFCDTFAHLYRKADLDHFLQTHLDPAGLCAQIQDPNYRVRIALDGKTIAGFAKIAPCGLPSPPVPAGSAELRQLYVGRAWQGEGVAGVLMDWVIDTVRSDGASHLVLSVYSDNHRAKRFYARYGLSEIGAHRFKVGEQMDDDRIWSVAL